jgi:hypothetical protein
MSIERAGQLHSDDSGAAPQPLKSGSVQAHAADPRPPEPTLAQLQRLATELGYTVHEFEDYFCVE